MWALDYRIEVLDVEHRRSLLSLLKLEFGMFEPFYVRIPALPVGPPAAAGAGGRSTSLPHTVITFRSKPKAPAPLSTPFGVIAILPVSVASSFDESVFNGIDAMAVEIFHDREELTCVCCGRHTVWQAVTDEELQSQKCLPEAYLQPVAMRRVSVELFHRLSGQRELRAGTMTVSIVLHRIVVENVWRPVTSGMADLSLSPSVPPVPIGKAKSTCRCHLTATDPVLSSRPAITIPTLPARRRTWMHEFASRVPETHITESDPISDTREQSSAESDNNSVDEFVTSFTRGSSMASSVSVSLESSNLSEQGTALSPERENFNRKSVAYRRRQKLGHVCTMHSTNFQKGY